MSQTDQPIWILTINDDNNYGNRLQNYALQIMLKKYSINVSTINAPTDISLLGLRGLFPNHIRQFIFVLFKKIKKVGKILFFSLKKKSRMILLRKRAFHQFTQTYVNDSKFSYSLITGLSRKLPENSLIVVGSDQVWNTTWLTPAQLKMRLGAWASPNSLISYAASFGIDNISDSKYRKIFKEYLPCFSSLSVREDQGAEIIRDLVNKQSSVVLDPTLMLTREQWLEIVPKQYKLNSEKYILTYFLGEPSLNQKSIIQKYAKEHNCKIRKILDPSDLETYRIGPKEFVGLFANAQYVFTDSYHACCFSILFEKQFKVFNRANISSKENMNSRMRTLFRLFELNSTLQDDSVIQVDYKRINVLLKKYREASWDYLTNAINKVNIF